MTSNRQCRQFRHRTGYAHNAAVTALPTGESTSLQMLPASVGLTSSMPFKMLWTPARRGSEGHGKKLWIPKQPPFTLQCGACFVPEDTMENVWEQCSIPDLLSLVAVSRSVRRCTKSHLLTMARFIELWGGCPSIHAVPYESSACQCAFTFPMLRGGAPGIYKSNVPPSLCPVSLMEVKSEFPLDSGQEVSEDQQTLQSRGSAMLAWVLYERLKMPSNHIIFQFLQPQEKPGVIVSDFRMARSKHAAHYVFMCRSSESSELTGLHLSVRKATHKSGRQMRHGWYPDRAGKLLGSKPWELGTSRRGKLGGMAENSQASGQKFATGDRVKVRRPLVPKRPAVSGGGPKLPVSHGTIIGCTFQGVYCVRLDGEQFLPWYSEGQQLMSAAEPFQDAIFRAIELQDVSVMRESIAADRSADLKEHLMFAIDTNFLEGVALFPVMVLTDLRDLLASKFRRLLRAQERM
eukprot:CAMPEP_0170585512 /NCGR_PEP_ID=MMETSP0224-20130122/9253_1 /TAXON_ID=285029 /ORGANISM="Togula jolla, Strain CCCM 725" /LENGTH=461 /DNA_ID=CAMNT_0010909001 /DNA_START=45 /DNA_END=1430 /DNA_ORIENTATION=+